jgi:hypothetical protein
VRGYGDIRPEHVSQGVEILFLRDEANPRR